MRGLLRRRRLLLLLLLCWESVRGVRHESRSRYDRILRASEQLILPTDSPER